MIFRRERFGDLVRRQLDLFETDEAELLDEAAEADTAWTTAAADETEELYGDYQLVVDAVGERLYDVREAYAATLEPDAAAEYRRAFDRAALEAFQEPRELSPRRRGRVVATCRIEDYGLIGDLQTVALVSRLGSVDWLCFPRFDSGAIFAVAPRRRAKRPLDDAARRGVPLSRDGATAETRSCSRPTSRRRRAPFGSSTSCRRAEKRRTSFASSRASAARVDMRMELVLRFDYGSIVPWVRNLDGALVAVAGPDAVCVRTPIELQGRNLRTYAEFQVREGERIPFVLTWFPVAP